MLQVLNSVRTKQYPTSPAEREATCNLAEKFDTEVSAEQAPELANVVRAWLVGEQIIEQEESDSVLSGTGLE